MADFSGMQQGAIDLAKHLMGRFPELVLVSGYRPGEGSYHGSGEAADLAVLYADHPADVADRIMYDVAKYIMGTGIWRQLVEGIHNPDLSVKNGTVQPDPLSFWGAETWAAHANHNHVAIIGAFHPPPAPTPVVEPVDVPTMIVLHER